MIRHVEQGELTHSAISRRLWISCAMISQIRPQARERARQGGKLQEDDRKEEEVQKFKITTFLKRKNKFIHLQSD